MAGMRSLIGGKRLVLGRGNNALDTIFGAIDIVGAGEASASEVKAALEEHLAGKNATMVVDNPPTESRRFPLGFPTTAVLAGNTATVSAQPQILFRGERLIVPSDIAGGLNITSVTVGKDSQVAAANPLPARTYTEQGWCVDMQIDTADISQFVQLGLSNTSSHDITFNGQYIGRSVQ